MRWKLRGNQTNKLIFLKSWRQWIISCFPFLCSVCVACSQECDELLGTPRTLSWEVQWALVVVFAVEDLESVFPLVLLRGLADLQPCHLLTSSNPHVLTGWDLSLSTTQHGWAQLTSGSHAHTCEGPPACLSVAGLVRSLPSGWGLFTRLLTPMAQ